jgi:putative polyhydroxyalkanoic acid system protein
MASTPITVSIAHQLGRAEARRRIENGFATLLARLPGSGAVHSACWAGDSLTFSVAALGQSVAGVIDVLDAEVRMEIRLPGILGWIAGGLKHRLHDAGRLLLTKK